MPQSEGFYQHYGNTKPAVKSPGVCGYCNIMVPSARFRTSNDGKIYCDDSCQQAWTQQEIRKTTVRIVNIAQELKMDCCYTAEELHRSRFEELKKMAMKVVRQIKSQLLKAKDRMRKAKVHLLNELYALVRKLSRLLGVKEDFAIPVSA